ncbi:MAG: carboxypeptidase M32 [Chloroflexi bacterium]|nr:carboxypeptidase M32 [Chloroflexota bacterium]
MATYFEQLKARLAQVSDLQRAAAVLEWDQQVNMPHGGSNARARQLATLHELAHTLFVAEVTGDWLEHAAAEVAAMSPDSNEACLVRVTRRDYDRLRRVPGSLVAERAQVTAEAFQAWEQARAESRFAMFAPHLQRVLDVTSRSAEALGYEDCIYDALLDQFEPEMRTKDVTGIFAELRNGLVRLVRAISDHGRPIDDSVLSRRFPEAAQWDFGLTVLEDMGFDTACGRQDRSAHPFTTSFSPHDVRITTRINPNQLHSGLFSTVHEGGHALYDQGISMELDRTPLCDGASFSLHESQSRLWENIVARSHCFWTHYLPRLTEYFPQQLADQTVDSFYRAINRVEPSLIRVEADEVTYNLHIFLRFELEQELLEGRLKVSELPEAWNAKMESYLGILPGDDATGVLQDVHWSSGSFGYFPSYALGNLLAVQFYNQALQDMPELPDQIAQGYLHPLRAWLRDHIHIHGKKMMPDQLVRQVTGQPLSAAPFLTYLETKYAEIYGL